MVAGLRTGRRGDWQPIMQNRGEMVRQLPMPPVSAGCRPSGAAGAQSMGENDLLVLYRDRALPMVVVPWVTWQRLLVEMRKRA